MPSAERPAPGEVPDPSRWLHPGVREVYRDASLWVLDKPAGVLSHPNTPRKAPNVLFRAPYDRDRELFRLRRKGETLHRIWLVHRLDLETSGLIVCAFDESAAAALQEALGRREVEKEYTALVVGVPHGREGEWEDRLEKTSRRGRADVRVARGRPNAVTGWRLHRSFPACGLSLLLLAPRTGRTHQLRVQAASRGLPIAGDERYGDFRANRFLAKEVGLKRMFLHASRLVLRHPRGRRRLRLTAELGPSLEEPLARLEAGFAGRVPRRESGRGR